MAGQLAHRAGPGRWRVAGLGRLRVGFSLRSPESYDEGSGPRGGLVTDMRVLDAERRLERVERLLRAAADEARSARIDLGRENGENQRWAAMMFSVLDQLDREGGEVSRQRFLEIGEEHAYNHRGMAGFYQQLVEPTPNLKTRLTGRGRERLQFLHERYGT
jgi:hypothetical protein